MTDRVGAISSEDNRDAIVESQLRYLKEQMPEGQEIDFVLSIIAKIQVELLFMGTKK